MTPVTYCNISNCLGISDYKAKALANIEIFKTIFGKSPAEFNRYFEFPKDENYALMEKISNVAGIHFDVVKGVNIVDETLNFKTDSWYACTSIGTKNLIAQTLDLYTVDLCIVREPDAIYITMPPYLTLMGIGRHLAFCTNHLFSGVTEGNTPISYIRHELLKKSSLIEALNYLDSIKRMTSVNFLICDGKEVMDIEVSPEAVKILPSENGYAAHTNHRVDPNFYEDKQCSRLTRAVELLKQNTDFKTILADKDIDVPITYFPDSKLGFGTIIKVVMDLKDKSLTYKDSTMKEYRSLWL